MRSQIPLLLALGLAACDAPQAPPAPDVDRNAKSATISRGEAVDIEASLPETGRTLVEFGADW